jgi:AAA family ATP:ADP antiporter
MTSESGWSGADAVDPKPPPGRNWIAKLVDVRPGEGLTLVLSAVYFFTLLAAYSVLKPVREAMGITGGADKLPVLFSGTMVAMLVLSPVFAWLVTRVKRRVFIPAVYAISIVCLLAFWFVFPLVPQEHERWIAYPFFVFISVFNLFVVSVFWGFMADLWDLEQAKRLYGFLGAGGTLGAIAGAKTTAWLATRIGSVNLLFVSMGLLVGSLVCIQWLMAIHSIDRHGEKLRVADRAGQIAASPVVRRADIWAGMRLVWTSPYLRAIAAYTALYGLTNTFLYIQQGNLVSDAIKGRDEQTRFFSQIDFWANSVTFGLQIFLTGRMIRKFGITFALNSQPVIALVGTVAVAISLFAAPSMAASGIKTFGLPPQLFVLAVVVVLMKASNFATARPAREALYTVVDREMKYKSKSFIDTVVFRAADFTAAWSFKGLQVIAMTLPWIAVVAIPLTGVWILVGGLLGRRQRELVAETSAAETVGSQTSASKSAAIA